jgi:1-deoxy-D-xylulose-5-phosphate synthase
MYKILNQINDPHDLKGLTNEELETLSIELRTFIVDNVSTTGGHLASNLGMIEITMALLLNYDFTKDKIVFDVGHQSYAYKILTSRREQFNTLRKYKGISGFPKRKESTYDYFDTGHSSNSISAAIGMARARDLNKEGHEIVAVIGDGAFTGGMVYEALNDVGYRHTKMLIILNDNKMSISPNVGGLANCLNKIKLNKFYNHFKTRVKIRTKDTKHLFKFLAKTKESIKNLFYTPLFFETLGIRYIGPIDGHNIKQLNHVLEQVKHYDGPIVLHIITNKGYGYAPALNNPSKYHAVGKFDIATGDFNSKNELNYSLALGNSLCELAESNPQLVAITAAMTEGTGLTEFAGKYPDRFYDVGIAEEHAVTLASGLAESGFRPVVAIYSTFMQRAFDQIIMDVCMQQMPVIFALDRSGLVGSDGETHQGIFDISYLSLMPNLIIVAPKTPLELKPILEYALEINSPLAIRYPRGGISSDLKPLKKFKTGKWEILSKGNRIIILATGKMVEMALKASVILKEKDIYPTIVNACFIKPLDNNMLKDIVDSNYKVLTLEDNTLPGGFGSQVLLALNNFGFREKIKIMAFDDKFIEKVQLMNYIRRKV